MDFSLKNFYFFFILNKPFSTQIFVVQLQINFGRKYYMIIFVFIKYIIILLLQYKDKRCIKETLTFSNINWTLIKKKKIFFKIPKFRSHKRFFIKIFVYVSGFDMNGKSIIYFNIFFLLCARNANLNTTQKIFKLGNI